MKRHDAQECLWKNRYEQLKMFITDAEIAILKQDFEKAPHRVFLVEPKVYISFSFDAVADEEKANELFGEGKYDTYVLEKTGDGATIDDE